MLWWSSQAVGDPSETVSPTFPSKSAGQVMLGGVVSTTVTLNEPMAELLEPSFAVQVTWCVPPSAKNEPEVGTQLTNGLGSTMSLAVGVVYVTLAPPVVLPSTVMSAGTS
jgi:hypothetical protein